MVFLFFIILLVGFPGYMVWEAESPAVTILRIPGAPEGIVFIADPHIRQENTDTVRKVIVEINRIQPALVLIGGDFTTHGEKDPSLQEIWGEIDAPVYAVLGNHDYGAGIKETGSRGRTAWVMESILRSRGFNASPLYSEPGIPSPLHLEEVLDNEGVTVLKNEYAILDINGRSLIIYGMDDIWAGRAVSPEIPDTGAYIICLVHEPAYREEWEADLILAGHTHGGQFSNGVYSLLDYFGLVDIRGLSVRKDSLLYVTRGIGTSKTVTDFRLFTSPEIVLINPRQG